MDPTPPGAGDPNQPADLAAMIERMLRDAADPQLRATFAAAYGRRPGATHRHGGDGFPLRTSSTLRPGHPGPDRRDGCRAAAAAAGPDRSSRSRPGARSPTRSPSPSSGSTR